MIPLPSKCRIGKLLGSGQFGSVHQAIWHKEEETEIEVAVKSLKNDALEDENIQFLQEAAIIAQFKSNNVVRLFGVVTDNPQQVCFNSV